VVGSEKTFYSHRHTFATLARGKMVEETSDAITGHSSGKISREYGYYPMDIMREGIEKIASPLPPR
jgi:integrase